MKMWSKRKTWEEQVAEGVIECSDGLIWWKSWGNKALRFLRLYPRFHFDWGAIECRRMLKTIQASPKWVSYLIRERED